MSRFGIRDFPTQIRTSAEALMLLPATGIFALGTTSKKFSWMSVARRQHRYRPREFLHFLRSPESFQSRRARPIHTVKVMLNITLDGRPSAALEFAHEQYNPHRGPS